MVPRFMVRTGYMGDEVDRWVQTGYRLRSTIRGLLEMFRDSSFRKLARPSSQVVVRDEPRGLATIFYGEECIASKPSTGSKVQTGYMGDEVDRAHG